MKRNLGLALAIQVFMFGGIAGAHLASASPGPQVLPPCQYEDGNPDGTYCFWTDPDTGTGYYVDSENYR